MSISKTPTRFSEDLIILSVHKHRARYGYKFRSDIVFEIPLSFVVVEVEHFDFQSKC